MTATKVTNPKSETEMPTPYKFRAECLPDVFGFLTVVGETGQGLSRS